MNVNGNFNLSKIQIPGLGMPQGETPSVNPESPTSDITLPGASQDVEPEFAPETSATKTPPNVTIEKPAKQESESWWKRVNGLGGLIRGIHNLIWKGEFITTKNK